MKQDLWLPECVRCARPKAPRGCVPVKSAEIEDYCTWQCPSYEEWPPPVRLPSDDVAHADTAVLIQRRRDRLPLRGGDGRSLRDPEDGAVTRAPLHRARLDPWLADELKAHLASIVDALSADKDLPASPLDVMLELLNGELEAFVLFGRMGHLDPPRADGKVPIGILQRRSDDPEIDARIRETVKKWAIEQEGRS